MQADYWQSFLIGTLSIAVTVIVAGLRPDITGAANQSRQYKQSNQSEKMLTLTTVVNRPVAVQSQALFIPITTLKTDEETNQLPEPEALTLLNELLLDFFTTDFNELTQAKWQQNLYMGSPFLAELADYLKLDQIYGFELNQISNRSLSEDFWRIHKSNEVYNANIFSLLLETKTTLWPMSIFTSTDLEKPVAKILLNHYDRAFLSKIESHALAKELRPLAKGIERLLAYHMESAVYNHSAISLTRYENNIDSVVSAMVAELGSEADLFQFYQMAILQKWKSAAQWLVQSDYLNQPDFLFLYDLIAKQTPDILVNLASFETISKHPTWWAEFLNYELCISDQDKNNSLFSFYSPVSAPCSSHTGSIGQVIKTRNHHSVSLFINKILQKNILLAQDIQVFVSELSPDTLNDITAINSHTVLDQLAKEGKLKTLRNAQIFRNYEKNYQAWRRYMNLPSQDSFFTFAAIHHWYSNSRKKQQQSINHEMPNIISRLSPLVQLRLAQSLLERYEAGLLTEKNWTTYKPLVQKLSNNEQKEFQTLSRVIPWLTLSDTKTKPDSSKNTPITEQTIFTILMHDLHRTMDQANSLEDFLNRSIPIIRNHHLLSHTMANLSMIDNNGKLSLSATRQLTQIWHHNHI